MPGCNSLGIGYATYNWPRIDIKPPKRLQAIQGVDLLLHFSMKRKVLIGLLIVIAVIVALAVAEYFTLGNSSPDS